MANLHHTHGHIATCLAGCMSSFLSFPVEAQLRITEEPLLFCTNAACRKHPNTAVFLTPLPPPHTHCVQNHQSCVHCSDSPTPWLHSFFHCMLVDGINSDVIL